MTVVATDLDGTLLDEDALLAPAARASLGALRRKGIPVVSLTSKTEAELRRWLPEIGSDFGAFENGAGILGPDGTHPDPAALSLETLSAALADLAQRAGLGLVPLGALSDRELLELTGLSGDAATRARQREFDVPFLAPEGCDSALERAAEQLSAVSLVRGGRFWHLSGKHDKAGALARIVERYGLSRPLIGCGDAPNDEGFLSLCDRVVLVPSSRGIDRRLRARFPGAVLAPSPGGEGWAGAVRSALRSAAP